mgnify:CR=1 FL=1
MSYSNSESLTQLENLAFMATTVISGKGEGIVLAVGKDTLYGGFTKEDPDEKQSFQKGANSIAWVMLRFIAVLIPIVFILLQITGGRWLESFAFVLSVAVGLMPEMLPMVITACLARGSLSMSKKQTIIKDINAMQGFGSMDVLCMDKTGTLTNESILLEYYMDVLGNESGQVLDFVFLNSAYHSGVCNPIDNAILACQTMPGHEQHFSYLLMRYQKEDEIPFDYSRKFVSTLVTDKNGDCQLIMKGNISQIVSRCSHVEFRGEILPMEKNGMQSVASVVDEMLQDGMKVIAVARKKIEKQDQIIPTDENNMILMGYLAFFDAPKKTAKTSVEALKRLQVTPKILTGDQADVAASICRRVKIPSEIILTGVDLDQMTDDELGKTVENIHVFAELTSGQKVRIVSALRQNGHTVGFLGDGINDIPALCESNVGISVDTSSIFDFTTYIFMYFVFCPLFVSKGVLFNDLAAHYSGTELAAMQARYIGMFQAGWFVESMWSQTLVIHMIRTPKLPFIQSRASAPVTLLTMTGIAVLTVIPFTPFGTALGLVALPVSYFAYLIPCILLYMMLATSLKKAYVRYYGELL